MISLVFPGVKSLFWPDVCAKRPDGRNVARASLAQAHHGHRGQRSERASAVTACCSGAALKPACCARRCCCSRALSSSKNGQCFLGRGSTTRSMGGGNPPQQRIHLDRFLWQVVEEGSDCQRNEDALHIHTNSRSCARTRTDTHKAVWNLQGNWHCTPNAPSMPHPDFQVRELEPVRMRARSYGAEPRPLVSAGGITDLPSSTCSS